MTDADHEAVIQNKSIKIRAERVIRIIPFAGTKGWLFPVPCTQYVKCVVGYRYFVGDKGPYRIDKTDFQESDFPPDTESMTQKWKEGGMLYSPGIDPDA